MGRREVEERLEAHGVMPTPQRVDVATILLERPQHLSAEQILERLRDRGSRVSKATIYNTLKLFSEKGLAREVNVDPSRLFYDSTTEPHHHFYNVDTGELSDIFPDQVAIRDVPRLPEGTEQESVELLIRVRTKDRES